MMPAPLGAGIAYLRVSTDRQDHERQVQDVQRWLERRGLKPVETVEDTGSRLQAKKRADFQRLFDRVRSGEFGWVVIQTIDRLGFQHTYEYFKFIAEFMEHGVQLWSALEDKCLTETDDGTVLTNAVAGQTSSRELLEKANRTLTKRVMKAKQGMFLGGIPPYGFDVVCINRKGVEQWRYVMTGRKRGIQVFPDGTRREVGAIPWHDKNSEDNYLRPSIISERVETLRRIFNLYDSSAISSLNIAKLLNEERVDAVITDRWKHDAIWRLLQNSAAIGKPSANKVTAAKLLEYRDGQLQRRGPNDKFVRKDRSQWILPDAPLFDAIVPEEQFWRVLEKITSKHRKRNPRNENLYIAGLVVCGKCGKTMKAGWKPNYSNGKRVPGFRATYTCQTRHFEGPNNKTGCRFHNVTNETLRPFLDHFLASRGAVLEEMISAYRDKTTLAKLLEQKLNTHRELAGLYQRMQEFIDEVQEEHSPGVRLNLDFLPAESESDYYCLIDIYEQLYEWRRREMETELAALEDKHGRITAQYFDLPPLAQALAKEKINDLEADIARIKARLEPLHQQIEACWADLQTLKERIEGARVTLEKGSLRQIAEVLRSVIDRIECRFSPKGNRHSRLEAVTVIPIVGDPLTIEASEAKLPTVGSGCRGPAPPARRSASRSPRPAA
jgi:DNA invertase Pin-like site-specific DNA recombinase